QAFRAIDALDHAPIRPRTQRQLSRRAWDLANEMGWAKTYDAEYLALAQFLNCRFVTLDARLHRSAARLGFVVSPTELSGFIRPGGGLGRARRFPRRVDH